MPLNKFENIKGIIWDLDNTLYRFEGDFEKLCHVAAARAAMKCGFDMSYEETLALCLKSYDVYGHSYRLFIEEYGIAQDKIHFDFHSFIDEKLLRREAALIALFEQSGLKHVMVTHASREWAGRALAHIGLKPFFPDEKIIPAEDINFMRKSESSAPFEKALALLGLAPENTLVVEDIAENLRLPKTMNIGTVLVHYGRGPDPLPGYIDYGYNHALEFMADISA